jgi:hypothetical protein
MARTIGGQRESVRVACYRGAMVDHVYSQTVEYRYDGQRVESIIPCCGMCGGTNLVIVKG